MGHDNNTADAPADAHELLTAADRAVAVCRESGFTADVIGEVVSGHRNVKIR